MSTLDIINKILVRELPINDNRVWAYNQDVDLPKDEHLFIVLSINQKKPYANNSKFIPTKNSLNEKQTLNIVEDITISLMSKNQEAQEAINLLPMAFNSMESINTQTKYKIHISPIGQTYDVSFLEATAMLNRFDYKIRVFSSYEKINSVDYYDKFNFEIWTNNDTKDVYKTQLTIQEN